jgi:hypothetical protein
VVRRAVTCLLAALLCACGRSDTVTQVDIARVAIRTLFLVRERPQAITLWRDTVSLTLGTLAPGATPRRVPLDSAVLGLPIPTHVADQRSMEAFFREHPAGWDAWFLANPANGGLIEVAEPEVEGNDARVVVGRACGEHCRAAWRLTLTRIRHEWVVQRIEAIPLPRG